MILSKCKNDIIMVKNLIMGKEIESSKRSHFLKDGEISSSFYEEFFFSF